MKKECAWVLNFWMLLLAGVLQLHAGQPQARKPNVIVILTDDQGYGEIAAHGNPVIKTPHLDHLHAESVRLTDFHVDPTCSPSRSALMTGRYSTRTGVWHTINGRSMMHPDECTLAELFKANGYATAMIGKWHLGDNAPCRPQDQGFDHAVWHQGGGLDNAPAYWRNDYFDDTYKVNDRWQKFDGYCTDVWFSEASKFVERHQAQPFFLYLAPNAPHSPHHVPDKYAAPYLAAGMPGPLAKFYGMIANIDENLGRFRARLAELGLAENTLLVFLTDNGTTAGWIDLPAGYKYYNAGMRAWKSSAYDGGHRVPCFWHWPKGGLTGGRDVAALTSHLDILPTFMDLLGLEKREGRPLDGSSLRAALEGRQAFPHDRTLFVHVQRAYLPPKWKESAAMTQRWRLVDGKELFDIVADPGQQTDVASKHPEIVARLREDYEKWWTSLEPAMKQTVRYAIGGAENPICLSSHDWLMADTEPAAWHHDHIEDGKLINGAWAVEVIREGTYEISLYRWPPYLGRPMNCKEARLSIGGVDSHMSVPTDADKATFRVKLKAGPTMLQTWLTRPDGKQHGAYFTSACLAPVLPNASGAPDTIHDVVVYGDSSGAVTAALSAKREGRSVLWINPTSFPGGMSASGLGATDFLGKQGTFGGIAKEFYAGVAKAYGAEFVRSFEPHVGKQVFEKLIADAGVTVIYDEKLDRTPGKGVTMEGKRITAITTLSGKVYRGKMFIDATYVGDLMAAAGVTFTVGREPESQYGEDMAGVRRGDTRPLTHTTTKSFHDLITHDVDPYVVPGDPSSGLLPRVLAIDDLANGTGDRKIQAYNYRVCLTRNPELGIPLEKPEGYRAIDHELLLRNFEAGDQRMPALIERLAGDGDKVDWNHSEAFGSDHPGANWDYPEASYERRRKIEQAHETYIRGFLWTMANSPRVPEKLRQRAAAFGLPKDEFTDNGGWPWMIYIREARRMVGDYVMTQHDCEGRKSAPDPVGLGSFGMDSHCVQYFVTDKGTVQNEGVIWRVPPQPYGISYRAIIPKRGECENLFSPICLSASHVAHGSIRMEPVFMVLSQSAAIAAGMAIDGNVRVQDVPYPALLDKLEAAKQIVRPGAW